MTITDILTSPWAITPGLLLEMQAIYEARSRGEAMAPEAFEAMLAKRPDTSKPARYEVVDGVAVLEINGVLAQKANMFTAICGGMSMQMAQAEVNRAVADRKVESILMPYDSPGGTVLGTPEFAQTSRWWLTRIARWPQLRTGVDRPRIRSTSAGPRYSWAALVWWPRT
jgi:hypothetical protein